MAFFRRPNRDSTLKYSLQYVAVLLVAALCAFVSSVIFVGSSVVTYRTMQESQPIASAPEVKEPFPLGVDPLAQSITEHPNVDGFLDKEDVPTSVAYGKRAGWFQNAFAKLAQLSVFQNLASPGGRVLVIQSGERKEEIAENFGRLLGWTPADRKKFIDLVNSTEPPLADGKFTPATYLTARGATPQEVAPLVLLKFENEISSRYSDEIAKKVPLQQALTIASLLEREAYDFDDMRYISGIIWNRLFIGMNLQLDATLQYAKGSTPSEPWWPRVVPNDKYIASVYNTYKNKGLPPAPIANPSLDAVLAALNPRKTDCMFYFHDSKAGFHCAKTYKEHVALLKQYYGRGK